MIDCRAGYLIINLRLQQIQVRLCEFGLGIQNKEIGFGAEFVLALFGGKRLLSQVVGNPSCLQRYPRFFQLANRVVDLQSDLFLGLPGRVEVTMARYQCSSQIGFRSAIPDWKVEGKRRSVSRKSEATDRKSTRLNSSHLGISY